MSEYNEIDINNIPQNVLLGCVEESNELRAERIEYLKANTTDFSLIGADDLDKGYVVNENDEAFQKYLDLRIAFFKQRYERIFPGMVEGFKNWNQKSNGTCTSMGFTHAAQATNGYNFLYGTPLINEAYNPMYLYMYGKNFRYSEGEALYTFVKNMQTVGNSPVRYAGDDCVSRNVTRSMWEKTHYSEYQTTICEITNKQNAFRCLQAGLGLAFGSMFIPTAIDDNGNITKSTSGAHCQSCLGWDFTRDMLWYQNSWGPQYLSNQYGGFIKSTYFDRFNMFGKFGNPFVIIATEYKILGQAA